MTIIIIALFITQKNDYSSDDYKEEIIGRQDTADIELQNCASAIPVRGEEIVVHDRRFIVNSRIFVYDANTSLLQINMYVTEFIGLPKIIGLDKK